MEENICPRCGQEHTIVKTCPFCGEIHPVYHVQSTLGYDENGHPILGEYRPVIALKCANEKTPPFIALELWQARPNFEGEVS